METTSFLRAVGVVTACIAGSGCAGGLATNARLESARTVEATATYVDLEGKVAVTTPSGKGLGIDAADVTVMVGDAEVLSTRVDLEPTVIIRDTGTVSVPVRVEYSNLSTAVPDAWSRPKIDYRMKVALLSSGKEVKAGEASGSFAMLSAARVTLAGIRFEGMDAGDPELKIDLRIFNENAQAVELRELKATVNLGGIEVANNRKHDERLSISPSGDLSVRFVVPIDLDANPMLRKKIESGFETIPFFADGKCTIATAVGAVSADFHVEGGIVLSR